MALDRIKKVLHEIDWALALSAVTLFCAVMLATHMLVGTALVERIGLPGGRDRHAWPLPIFELATTGLFATLAGVAWAAKGLRFLLAGYLNRKRPSF